VNEKFLNDLLASGIRRGEIDLEVNDKVVDSLLSQIRSEASDQSKARVKSKVKVRIEDAAISQSKHVIQWKGVPFGRYIEAVRERAGLTRFAIADRLGKDESYLQRLERGDISPAALPIVEVVKVVELFHLKLNAVNEMLLATSRVVEKKRTFRAAARSHGGMRHDTRSEDVERALDAFTRKIQGQKVSEVPDPKEIQICISKLEVELKKRGRVDLVT